MKLHSKLNLAFFSIALLSLVSSSVLVFNLQKKEIIRKQAEQIALIEQGIGKIMDESVLAADPLMLADYLNGLGENRPEIAQIKMFVQGRWHTVKQAPEKEKRAGFIRRLIRSGEMKAEIEFGENHFKKEREKTYARLAENLLVSIFFSLLISLLAALLISKNTRAKLRKLASFSEKIASNRFGEKVDIKGDDEISQLGKSFNAMSEKLAEIDDMKKTFLSSVTHELKAPLGAVSSYINLIMRGEKDLSKETVDWLKRCKANLSRLSGFVNSLLTTAKMERGEFEIKKRPCSLKEIIRDVSEFFGEQAKEAGVAITLRTGSEAERTQADPEMISHVISNLVSNAVKFSRKNTRVKIESETNGKGTKISVENLGAQIPPEKVDALFKPFSRLKNEKNAKGTGLGLYVAKKIIDAHGGEIGFKSGKDGKTVFWFFIPGG